MNKIEVGSLVSFVYDNKADRRYVDVVDIKPHNFSGADYSRVVGSSNSYRTFRYDKVSSLQVVAKPDECVLPMTAHSFATVLSHLDKAARVQYNETEDVLVIKKDVFKNIPY